MPKDTSIRAIPATATNPTGTVKVHFNIPKLLKNKLNSGFTIMPLITRPTAVEIIIAGIKDNAVCKIS